MCSNKTAGQQELVTPPATRRHPARVDSEIAIAELDGHAFHGPHRGASERDRVKDLDLAAAGHVVVRVTWTRLAHEPDREAARLRTVLAHTAP